MPAAPSFWSHDRHFARRPALIARARLAAAIRRHFELLGFLEVDTAALQRAPGGEAHLHAFATRLREVDGEGVDAYLHTSPEFAMKKLLAAGESRIFSLSHVFRNRERGALHAPEFTMLEWYRAGAALDAVEQDCLALLRWAADAAGTTRLAYKDRDCDPFARAERLSLREALQRHVGIDLYDSLPADGAPGDRDMLAAQAHALHMRVADDDSWSDIFSRILTDRIEPSLGLGRPTVLHSYPASEAVLARVSPSDARVAERFELYACGVELANAFDELTDAGEQRRRFEAEADKKQKAYGEAFPVDEDFLDALAAMPAASGAALGFDRLVMLATGAKHIDDVQWTPVFTPDAR